ncbi:MAG: flavin reductase family protein [Candidatus Izemoplasmataceae bacterium]
MHKEIQPSSILSPTPVVLVGAMVHGKANFSSISTIGKVGVNPPLIAVSLKKDSISVIGIDEFKMFSVNLPSSELLKRVDVCRIFSGTEIDKEMLFDFRITENIPHITDCKVNLFVDVKHRIEEENVVIYIGQVVKTLVDEQLFMNDALSMQNMRGIFEGPDQIYYTSGRRIGAVYQEGKHIIHE